MDVEAGYLISEDGRIVEVKGYDEAIRHSRRTNQDGSPNEDYVASQVFWTRQGAEDALAAQEG